MYKHKVAFWVMLIWLFIILYVAVAYYDNLYNCENKLASGKLSITRSMKPLETYPDEQLRIAEHNTLKSVHLLHLLIIGPLLMYSGYTGWTKTKMPIFATLSVIGGITAAYHGFRFNIPRI